MKTTTEALNIGPLGKASMGIAGLALGAGLFSMALAGWYYDEKFEVAQKAHRQEMAAMERRHTREKRATKREIADKLDEIQKRMCEK
ncbi:MAG: protein yippee-like [Bacteriophage sp.]|nr:MAG: protein yippee-like [Bacteriophage sp.]